MASNDDDQPTLADPEGRPELFDGRYAKVRLLGRGGFGEVYLVEDRLQGNERLALKLILPSHGTTPEFERRFRNEIRVLRSLQHEGIPQIYNDGRTAQGEFYFTMAFVEGRPLDAVLRERRTLPPQRVANIVRQLVSVLDYAHARGVVHRDLKPGNVLLVGEGTEKERVRVLDFGIAKILNREGGLELAVTLDTLGPIGTPHFMSPEQVRGKDIDGSTDYYALGVLIYHMVSGTFPFTGDTVPEVLTARLTEAPTPLPPDSTPPWLAHLVAGLLDRDRERRPRGDAVTAALAAGLAGVLAGQQRQHRTLQVLALAVLILSGAVGLWYWQDEGPRPAEGPSNGVANAPQELPESGGDEADPVAREAAPTEVEAADAERGGEAPTASSQDGAAQQPGAQPAEPGGSATPTAPAEESSAGRSAVPATEGAPPVTASDVPGQTAPPTPSAPPAPTWASLSLESRTEVGPEVEFVELRGSSDLELLEVTVNSVPASVSGRDFRGDLHLALGSNRFELRATAVGGGESEPQVFEVLRRAPSLPFGCDPAPGSTLVGGHYRELRHRDLDLQLVLVEAGSVRADGRSFAVPRPFYLGRHEVTVAQFGRHLELAQLQPSAAVTDALGRPELEPIADVTLAEAQTFCRSHGLRLPSEAEWLCAARGPEDRDYPWGMEFDRARVNLGGPGDPFARTAAVEDPALAGGVASCGAWNLADNVSEWCAEGLVLGGSYRTGAESARLRPANPANRPTSNVTIGFRVAVDAP
jgi:predicted Ser/Thr protein kinase